MTFELVGKPGTAVLEETNVTVGKGADVGSQITEDVFSSCYVSLAQIICSGFILDVGLTAKLFGFGIGPYRGNIDTRMVHDPW